MAIPLFVATVFMFSGTQFHIKILKVISFIILLINILYYIYRLKLGIIP